MIFLIYDSLANKFAMPLSKDLTIEAIYIETTVIQMVPLHKS